MSRVARRSLQSALFVAAVVAACNPGSGNGQTPLDPAIVASSAPAATASSSQPTASRSADSAPSADDARPAPGTDGPAPAPTAEGRLAAPRELEAGCKPARANDAYWDYPDRINAAHIFLKQTPTTALRGYLFWTSSTEACLRVDLRTVDAKTAGARADRPMVLGVRLTANDALRLVQERPTEYFDSPLPSTVYSLSTRVRCTAATRAECRTVRVFVEHPWAGQVPNIGIELKDAQ